MRIYLDHNAGAPLRPEARRAVEEFLATGGANPASVHRAGQYARRALELARQSVAALIGASARQIVFTSGGTEANNLALLGAAARAGTRRRVISSAIEHSSVMAALAELERRGFEVVRLPCDRDGRLAPESVLAALNRDTLVLSLGLANAEVGTIQDLAPLADAASRAGAIFHVDAVQAAGRIPLRVAELGCDLMTLSAHKLGGLAGAGALYVGDPEALSPLILGGPQERGLRAGTPNLAGAIAFGAAAAAARERQAEESAREATLSAELLRRLRDSVPGIALNGPLVGRLANTLNLTFPGVLGESLLIALDLEGVEVSMGSACAAGAVEASHVLLAMGRSAALARSSLRLSLGWSTTQTEVARAVEIIARVWRRVAAAEPVPANAPAGV